MPVACSAPSIDLPLVLRTASYVDCHAQALAANGPSALAAGALGAPLLTGLITICVALLGYRLLLGRRLDVASATSQALRVGAVIALATASPAYDSLIYSVAIRAPAEIANDLLPAAHITGGQTLMLRLQRIYDRITAKPLDMSSTAPADTAAAPGPMPSPMVDTDEIARGAAGALLLATSLGSWLALRLGIALLVAIGPLPILGLLFGATQGLFMGWARTLLGMVLASAALPLVLIMEVVLLESMLPSAETAAPIFALVATFAVITLALIFICGRTVRAMRLPSGWKDRRLVVPPGEAPVMTPAVGGGAGQYDAAARHGRSRAQGVADAVVAVDRRRVMSHAAAASASASAAVLAAGGERPDLELSASAGPIPASSVHRRSAARRSASATRRDSL